MICNGICYLFCAISIGYALGLFFSLNFMILHRRFPYTICYICQRWTEGELVEQMLVQILKNQLHELEI